MPKLPQHILVPVDGSETSIHAARYAWMLAQQFNAKVTIVHVMAHSIPGLTTHTKSMQMALDQEAKKVRESLDRIEADIFNHSLDVEKLILDGEVDKQITREANEGPYDLVVIGSQGRGAAIKRFFVGSVARYIVANVDKPVLVIDHPDNFSIE